MSMIFSIRRVSQQDLLKLQSSPDEIEDFLYPETEAVWDPQNPAVQANPDEIDLDKSWHAIHYLLTKSAWGGEPPGNLLLCGGKEIGDVDVGYGPARAVSPDEVKGFADFLAGTNTDDLKGRFEPSELSSAEVYPDIWEEEGSEAFEYIEHFFSVLRDFVAEAAQNGMGFVVWMS